MGRPANVDRAEEAESRVTQTETERRATAAILTVINDIGGDEPPVTSHSHTPHGSHTPPEAEDQEAEDAALLAGVRDGAWLDVQDFPPLRWAVPGLIPEGLTLLVGPPKAGKSWLLANLRSRGPESVEIATMLRKPGAAKVEVDVRYVGFDIPNEFVVGYGLDYAEKYRNLPFVGTLAPHVYSH